MILLLQQESEQEMEMEVTVLLSVVIVFGSAVAYVVWPIDREFTYSTTNPSAQYYVTRKGRWARIYEQHTQACVGRIQIPAFWNSMGISRHGKLMYVVDLKKRVLFYNLQSRELVHTVPRLLNVDFLSFDETDTVVSIHMNDTSVLDISMQNWQEVLSTTRRAA